MNVNFIQAPGCFLKQFYRSLLLLVCIFLNISSFAQTSISTTSTFTNTATANTVTFNFQNTNSYPVIITNVEGIVSVFGDIDVALWYKTTAINGSPGAISTANGWTLSGAQTIAGIGNTTTNITQPFLSNISLTIPANVTYGIAVSATKVGSLLGVQRMGDAPVTVTVGNGNCNVLSGANIGYAAVDPIPAAPTLTPKGWLGKIAFIPGNNCAGTPVAATISGPQNICANALFTLTATGYAVGAGLTYQWQRYNTTSATWEDVTGATTPNSHTSTGITVATQFRLKTTCTASSMQSLSNVITLGIGTGLPGGVYTINRNASSTSTNFVSVSAAAAAMKCGITGLVTLNMVPGSGPYTENPVFGNIPGTSAANQIRLNGNGEVVQYNIPVTTVDMVGILSLRGTKFMTIDSVTIKSIGIENGVGIVFSDTASTDSVKRCFIDMRSQAGLSSAVSAGISLSNYTTADYQGSKFIYIGYNYILGDTGVGGPAYGIIKDYYYVNTNSNNADSGNVIEHNTIENFVADGILVSGGIGTVIAYNDIHRTNKRTNSYFGGIRFYSGWNYNNSSTLTQSVKIIGNRIHNPSSSSSVMGSSFIGIQVLNWNNFNNQNNNTRTLIANNVIYNVNYGGTSSSVSGIYYGGGNYNNNNNNVEEAKILHNTIDLSGANAAFLLNTAGISYYNYYNSNNQGQNINIKNNLITLSGTSPANKFGLIFYNDNTQLLLLSLQRNNVYLNTSSGSNLFFCRSDNVNYPTLASFQAAYPTQEIGSLAVDPQYTSSGTGDFTPLNYALSGNGVNVLNDVPKDILGRARSAAPTPGAFEIAADAGVNALIAPVGTYCSSVKLVKVSIKNFGMLTINPVQVNWSLNGVLQTPVSVTSALLPGATTNVSLGNGLFLPSTPVTIKAWTSMPNGQPDGFPGNDTLEVITQSSTSVAVNIGPDDSICTGNTLTLDAGIPGAVYVWDNNATTQLRTIQNAGTYYVRVTALGGCIGVDTMKLSLRALPVVNLGPDKEICEGSTTTLDAGLPDGSFLWDDGSTMRTRTVDTAGVYEVQVTDIHGCKGVGDVNVFMKDMPLVDGINATHADSGLYTFYPLNPLYIISYRWDFGDGSPEQTGYMVQHQYARNGIYTVTLYLEGECTGLIIKNSRTVDVFNALGEGGTGINNIRFEGDITLYPNPVNNKMMIENRSEANMNRVVVYNTIGQVIIDQKADGAKQHQLHTAGLASGLYSIRIETDKGLFIRKFEVRR
jgi:hypothetical protein